MPLQHINDRMLKRMHRLGDRAALTALIDRIRTRIPGVTFRTAFIVGFPGETDREFDELRTFVEEAEFDRVAVFLYSDEEDTPAVSFNDKIDRLVMEDRRNDLLAVQEHIATAKGRAHIGSIKEVMVDGRSEEAPLLLEARHEGLAPEIDGVVYIKQDDVHRIETPPLPGDIVKVQITDAALYDLVGRILP
jgi:ribosomal protein S12 methylthiotransferase